MKYLVRAVQTIFTLAVVVILASACSEEPVTSLDEIPPPQASLESESEAEAGALEELTRLVALALQDDGLRQRIKNDMRNAPYLEHKLSFTRYVRGTSGGILLAAMAKNSDKTRQEIIALMESVRPLEFYMPVDEHREAWTGEANLLVVSALDEGVDAELNAFGLTGERVYISPVTPPSIPTFSLVPVETNFDRPLDMSEWENVNDQGGQAIGTYRRTKLTCPPKLVQLFWDYGVDGVGEDFLAL